MTTLTSDRGIRTRHLLPPLWHENGDLLVSTGTEPVDCQADSSAREHLLIAMAANDVNKTN